METLLIPLFLAVSIFFVFWYFGASLDEKHMIARRVRMLQEGMPVAIAKERLYKPDFNRKHKREANRRIENNPGFLVFLIVSFCLGLFLMHTMNLNFMKMLIFFVILPILTARLTGLMLKRARLERIQRELPGALDLMVVCLEAGLAINSALLRIANEMEGSPLGKELRRASDEVTAGIPLEDALRGMAKRIEVEDFQTIVSAIVQAQKMGSSLVLTFRVQAETLRDKFKMHVREKINRVPIKILFPLVFFLFPALFVVILGPSVIYIMQTLQNV